ncbi:MAG: hypothetical protein R3F07_07950 [Opitutaceae bacterium]
MPGAIESIEGTVLLREITGESFDRITVLSPTDGIVTFLHRRSRKSATNSPLDLFDRISVTVELKDAGTLRFSREVRILQRRPGLGHRYEGLSEACRYARLLTVNPVHEDTRKVVADLLNRALDAWERGDRADIVAVKCLFLFARTEGYPVREEWHRLLSHSDRSAATRLLNHRTGEVDLDPSRVGSIRRSLEHYLQYHTEIRIDPL